jgi:acetolactate synthase regulatory subunit
MCFDLMIRMSTVAGALQRVVGVVERRGYLIVGLHAMAADPGCTLVRLRVDAGERPVASLLRQLERLFDVREVALAGPAPRRERPQAV